jgi:hypothetical protein
MRQARHVRFEHTCCAPLLPPFRRLHAPPNALGGGSEGGFSFWTIPLRAQLHFDQRLNDARSTRS